MEETKDRFNITGSENMGCVGGDGNTVNITAPDKLLEIVEKMADAMANQLKEQNRLIQELLESRGVFEKQGKREKQ